MESLERLRAVDKLLTENQAQLGRLVDLYVLGEFPRGMLIDRKTRLEATISALDKERDKLIVHLEAEMVTEDQVRSIQELAAGVADGLDAMGDDFESRRRVIELLDVQATLTVEDGRKVVYAQCILGERVSVLHPVSQMNWLISDSSMDGSTVVSPVYCSN